MKQTATTKQTNVQRKKRFVKAKSSSQVKTSLPQNTQRNLNSQSDGILQNTSLPLNQLSPSFYDDSTFDLSMEEASEDSEDSEADDHPSPALEEQSTPKTFQSSSTMFQNDSECSRLFQNVPEYSKSFQSSSRTFLANTSECTPIKANNKSTLNKTINNKASNNKARNNKAGNNKTSNESKLQMPFSFVDNETPSSTCFLANTLESTLPIKAYKSPLMVSPNKTTINKTSNEPKLQMPFSFVANERPKTKKESPKPKFNTNTFMPGTIADSGYQYRIMYPNVKDFKKTMKKDTRQKQVGQKMDTSQTQVGQKMDTSQTQDKHKADTRRTQVRQKVDKKDTLCKTCNGRKVGHYAKRNIKCKVCIGCRTPKCGVCKNCLKPSLKKACIKNECVNPILAKCTCAPLN
jgi:hypothetical protein